MALRAPFRAPFALRKGRLVLVGELIGEGEGLGLAAGVDEDYGGFWVEVTGADLGD